MNNTELTAQEKEQLSVLINEAERNSTQAQQLVTDAGKLLSLTQERFEEYKNRGFFKRCWYKFSGKQGSLDRANQADLIKLQRFAWCYIMKLQEQNLIQAHSIAVIRNDLKDIVSEIGEIQGMIATIIEKFDNRITKIEDVLEIHDWLGHIEGDDKFDPEYPCICALQVVFDYISIIQKNTVSTANIESEKDLKTALAKLGLKSMQKDEITVKSFIQKLFYEIKDFSYEQFSKIIQLHIKNHTVSTDFILDNVSGAAYNALYCFDQEMNHMQHMAQNLKKDDPEQVMYETALASINNPDVKYSFIEIINEIFAGSILAGEIYKEKNLSDEKAEDLVIQESSFSIDDLLESNIEISFHAFLKKNPSMQAKQIYIESMALVFLAVDKNEFENKNDSAYLTALVNLFSTEESIARVKYLVNNPKSIDIPKIKDTLCSESEKYTWCMDAIFIGSEFPDSRERVRTTVIKMCKVFGFKENEITPLIDSMQDLVGGSTSSKLLSTILKINRFTDSWKTILDFKRLSLKGAFDDLKNSLSSSSVHGCMLSMKVSQVLISEDFMESSFVLGDENFLQKAALALRRSSVISSFKTIKDDVEKYTKNAYEIINQVNSILRVFGTEPVSKSPQITLSSISPDNATGIDNEHWGDNMSSAVDHLNEFLNNILEIEELLNNQLALYESGRYHESAVENAKAKKEEFEKQKTEKENSEKKILLSKGDKQISLSFQFKECVNLPFDCENIKKIFSFHGFWFVLEESLWKSEDCIKWDKVVLPCSSVRDKYVSIQGEYLLFWDQYETKCLFISADGIRWETKEVPNNLGRVEGFLFINGKWVMQTCKSIEYSYIEEGIIFDSEEKDTCYSTVFLIENAPGKWDVLKGLTLGEGQYVDERGIFQFSNMLVALSAYDYSYHDRKHITTEGAKFIYSENLKSWHTASFPVETFRRFESIETRVSGSFIHINDVFVCANERGIYNSKDGKEWEKNSYNESFSTPVFFNLGNLIGIADLRNSLHISTDGITFNRLRLEYEYSDFAILKDRILIANTYSRTKGMYIGEIVKS